jgi:hypothetical protein
MWDMFIKQRSESKELIMFRILNTRMNLSPKDLSYLFTLEKGYEGEKNFDMMMEEWKLSNNWLIINDLLLEFNNTFFQIDTVLILQDFTYLIDVKNFEVDYYVDHDRWYTVSKTEIKNPLDQLKRCESLFRRYLQSLGFSPSIESLLIFVNPDFYLYNAPLTLPAIFPSQLNRFFTNLKKKSGKPNSRNVKLAEILVANHIKDPIFTRIPKYRFEELKKGVTCKEKHSFMEEYKKGKLICPKCGFIEDVVSAVLHNVKEYKLLFPDNKITTNAMYEWCGEVITKKAIWRILKDNYKGKGHGIHTYYENE